MGVVAWPALIADYAERRDLSVAQKLFDEMSNKELVPQNEGC